MLRVENLHFAYGEQSVFSGISFLVQSGSLCGLFGPNGSGKSTLFKCCLKLLKAAKGSVFFDGIDSARLGTASLSRLVSYVPQEHSPPFPFLVREVVLMGRVPHSGGVFGIRAGDKKCADDAMKRLGIFDLADKAYTRLSGGQRQLVLIARAIAQDSELIMLDEPTASLDFKNQLRIWSILRDLASAGKTVFTCAHDPNHVSWFCDDVVVMHRGEVAARGHPSQALSETVLRNLYGDICSTGKLGGLRMIFPHSADSPLINKNVL